LRCSKVYYRVRQTSPPRKCTRFANCSHPYSCPNSFKASAVDSLLYKYWAMATAGKARSLRAPASAPLIVFCCSTPCSRFSVLSQHLAAYTAAPTPCTAWTPCCLAAVRERTKHRRQAARALPSSGSRRCAEKPANK
jgi:hypothetical protein